MVGHFITDSNHYFFFDNDDKAITKFKHAAYVKTDLIYNLHKVVKQPGVITMVRHTL